MWRYIELLSFESPATIEQWKRDHPRDVKARFAKEIVGRFHSPAAAQRAEEDFQSRFREGEMPADMPEVTVQAPAGGIVITQLLKQAGLTPSTNEAQRMIEQGGVKIDGERVSDKGLKIPSGRTVVVQVGKRKFARVTVK
jgi:tyrosyl-tRNA synthetase